MSTRLPAVVDALILLATNNLTETLVLDGYGNTQDPGNYIMVGVDDPNNFESATGGEAQSDWQHIGHNTRREEGSVTCAALAWHGDPDDLKSVRDAAFEIVAELEDALKADPTIGNTVLFASTSRHNYLPNASETGAEVIVVFTVNYVAYI